MKADLLVRGIGRLATCAGGPDEPLGVIRDAALVAVGSKVAWLGEESRLPSLEGEPQELQAAGRAVLPGLVDCHTHLLFAGERSAEFAARMRGEPYTAGGLLSTVRATRAADDDELVSLAEDRLDRFLGFGVTTVEAKSGYGLNVIDEARLVELAADLRHPVTVVSTLLAAHVVPPEFEHDPEAYVRLVCEDIVPAATSARFCDAWCDRGAFDVEQCRRVLQAGTRVGQRPKVHAEQLSHGGGAQLAAELGAVSADHLEWADEADARALSAAGVVGVLLPGASVMTRTGRPPARMLADAGVRIALSTDFNPGSSYTENLPLMAALGAAELGMTVEDAILGVTRNAAAALALESQIGSLGPGMQCDLLLLESDLEVDLAYHYGVNLTHEVIKAGRPVLRAG